jgi:rRNA maturation endonuclease Nob1
MSEETRECQECKRIFNIKITIQNKYCPYCGSKNTKSVDVSF